jgi:hypothetical protein
MVSVATRIRGMSRGRLATIVVVAIALIGFGVYWFGPQYLFLDRTADETLPGSGASSTTVLVDGSFVSLAHETSGTARLVQLEDGTIALQLEELSVLAGPDLRVYLSMAAADGAEGALDDDFVDLGELRANRGNLVYEVPPGTDLAEIRSVTIWCRRFEVGFGVASLE